MEFLFILHKLFSYRDKITIALLLISSCIVSIVETMSLSIIMLFISVATNFDLIYSNPLLHAVYRMLKIESPVIFIMFFGCAVLIFYGLRCVINIMYIYAMQHFVLIKQYACAVALFKKCTHLSYKEYVQKNTTSLHQLVFVYTDHFAQVMTGLLTIVGELLTVACVYGMLFYVNWKMTLALSCVLSIKVALLIKMFSKNIAAAGKRSQASNLQAGKAFNVTFSNYKFLKLLGNDTHSADVFATSYKDFVHANIVNTIWQGLPRFILETSGFYILVGVMLFVLFRFGDARQVIPIVSLYALAFYRFLPSLNKILVSYNQIMFKKNALQPIVKALQHAEESLGSRSLSFIHKIQLTNVSFSYAKGASIVSDVSLSIQKGERVGFVGKSGAGKTTLVDIIIGLLSPDTGSITIDQTLLTDDFLVAWRQKIGYIPQNVVLFDGTIAENIVCGRLYDKEKIYEVIDKAHLTDCMMQYDGIETRVGDYGIQLSGGQKQRVAIARALYANPEILVLDEATSALDDVTESVIMDNIYEVSRQKTLLIIAHRLSTIQRCDKIFKIENGRVVEVSASLLALSHQLITAV